jgi:hypothetical protein
MSFENNGVQLCLADDCPKKPISKGYCKQHYKRFIDRPRNKAKRIAKKQEERKNQPARETQDHRSTLAATLTPAQLEKIFLTRCKTEKDLKNYIKFFFGLHLPDVKVSRYADTTPFHAIWEVYDICANKNNPLNVQELLFVAGRGSGKTLGMAIAELMVLLHDERDVVHVGAILQQAKRCYDYQQKFLLSDKLRSIVSPPKIPDSMRILEKTTMEKSIFNINSSKVSLEVLPCTMRAVNGPHVPLVVVDEIDTVNGEGVKAYKEISGMLDSKKGKKPLRVGISTRKSRYGLMNQAIENAEKQGRHVRRWTAFEFTERCPDSRSGTDKQDYWIDQNSFDVKLPQEYDRLPDQKKKEYTKYDMYKGCYKCPLAPICLGDAKNQNSASPMLKTIDELAQKVLSEGSDWSMAQLMNLKPSVEGIIYKEFEERTHVKDWNQMWEILTGSPFPGVCDHDTFVKKCLSMRLACYAGIDFGWSNPHTLVTFFVDNRENIYVVRCDGQTYISRPTWMHHIKNKWQPIYRTNLYFPDLADPGDGVEMKKLGLPVSNNFEKGHIMFGVQIVKKWLKVPGSSEPKIFFAQETCQPIIKEFQIYHFKVDAAGMITDEPEKENDHWLDALRYAIVNLFGRSQLIMSSGGLDLDVSKIIDSQGNLMKPPTPEEYARINNIPFNSDPVDITKIGKIGRLSEIEGIDSETPEDGSFIWSM